MVFIETTIHPTHTLYTSNIHSSYQKTSTNTRATMSDNNNDKVEHSNIRSERSSRHPDEQRSSRRGRGEIVRISDTCIRTGLMIDADGTITSVEMIEEVVRTELHQNITSSKIEVIKVPHMDNIRVYYKSFNPDLAYDWDHDHAKYILPRNRYSDLFDHPLHGKIIVCLPNESLSHPQLQNLWKKRIF